MRFLLSGSAMIAGVMLLGYKLPRGRDLMLTALYGILILGGGNGCLVYSERLIPSSLAALFITLSPFWFSAIEALIPGGERLRLAVFAGIVTGFAGVALLIAPDLMEKGMHGAVWQGFLLLQLGSVLWVLGSILQKRLKTDTHPFANGAIQQFAAGVFFIVPALLEQGRPADFTYSGMGAVLYLVTFGSVIGFSSYLYALDKLPVAMVSLYTYINPVVAAALGWLFYREPFGWLETTAMAIVFVGVWLVKHFSRH
jgi:drug/metabolite transporter (DMT)-like permease